MKIAILTMFLLLSACNENCASKSANSRTRAQTSGADSTSGTITPPPPPPSTIADWQSKTADEISNFKDADGKNLFQLNINNPKALQDIITKVGHEKAKKMVIEGDELYVDGDGTVVTTKSPLRMAIENDDEEALNALLAIPGIEAELGRNINDNRSGFGIISLNNPTFLHLAAREGKAKAFTFLIKKDPELLKKTDNLGHNPLFNAVSRNQANIIEAFLD